MQMRARLEALIDEMLEGHILLDEAVAEFEKLYIKKALARHKSTSPKPRKSSESIATPSPNASPLITKKEPLDAPPKRALPLESPLQQADSSARLTRSL